MFTIVPPPKPIYCFPVGKSQKDKPRMLLLEVFRFGFNQIAVDDHLLYC